MACCSQACPTCPALPYNHRILSARTSSMIWVCQSYTGCRTGSSAYGTAYDEDEKVVSLEGLLHGDDEADHDCCGHLRPPRGWWLLDGPRSSDWWRLSSWRPSQRIEMLVWLRACRTCEMTATMCTVADRKALEQMSRQMAYHHVCSAMTPLTIPSQLQCHVCRASPAWRR